MRLVRRQLAVDALNERIEAREATARTVDIVDHNRVLALLRRGVGPSALHLVGGAVVGVPSEGGAAAVVEQEVAVGVAARGVDEVGPERPRVCHAERQPHGAVLAPAVSMGRSLESEHMAVEDLPLAAQCGRGGETTLLRGRWSGVAAWQELLGKAGRQRRVRAHSVGAHDLHVGVATVRFRLESRRQRLVERDREARAR
mmetsp:Transcript_27067/g.65288  ORF Transcript_27067/g.65288 Transcript_27067/m.65288 type:complete len:200 (-) Transcript_27067:2243-2842(-)